MVGIAVSIRTGAGSGGAGYERVDQSAALLRRRRRPGLACGGDGACACFDTGSFAAGVDLRHGGVIVRLITITHDCYGLSERDLTLARQISAVARQLDVLADPCAVQTIQLTIDALVGSQVLPFWRAVLDYRRRDDSTEDFIDPRGRGPSVWFQQMNVPRLQRNRIHIDIWVPHDQAEARIAGAVAAGGHLVTDEHAPSWWGLADAEGNEACIATTMGRD